MWTIRSNVSCCQALKSLLSLTLIHIKIAWGKLFHHRIYFCEWNFNGQVSSYALHPYGTCKRNFFGGTLIQEIFQPYNCTNVFRLVFIRQVATTIWSKPKFNCSSCPAIITGEGSMPCQQITWLISSRTIASVGGLVPGYKWLGEVVHKWNYLILSTCNTTYAN